MSDSGVAANFDLSGRVALVTGSSTGLGKAMAMALGAAGARVAMNYANNAERADAALDEFRSKGFEGGMFRASVIDEGEVNTLVSEIESSLGPPDIVVFNATPDQPQKSIEDYDWEFYQSMLDFFIKSPFLLTRRMLPHLRSQKWGRLINIGSEVVARGIPNFSAYVAAKAMRRAASTSPPAEALWLS